MFLVKVFYAVELCLCFGCKAYVQHWYYSGPCDEQPPHNWLYIAGGCSQQVHFNDK